MKYLNNYETETKRDVDLNRPMVSVIDGDASTLTYDEDTDYTVLITGSFYMTSKTTAPSSSGYLYKYSASDYKIITDINDTNNGKTFGININNGEYFIFVTYAYTHGTGWYMFKFTGAPDMYIEYGVRSGSGQGSSDTVTAFIYSNISFPLNTTLNYQIYDKV